MTCDDNGVLEKGLTMLILMRMTVMVMMKMVVVEDDDDDVDDDDCAGLLIALHEPACHSTVMVLC